jgi:hypothetical protein
VGPIFERKNSRFSGLENRCFCWCPAKVTKIESTINFQQMTVSIMVFLSLILFLFLSPFAASYSYNIDTDLDSSYKFTYSTGETSFGATLDTNHDFNNDGFNDVLTSSPNSNVAYLMLGGNTIPTGVSITFNGLTTSISSCRFAGDVNKDGYADILVGTSGDSGGGTVYLVLGGASTSASYSLTAVNARTITYTAATVADSLGSAVSGVGDVNKDGFGDFVICASTSAFNGVNQAGICYLMYGGNSLQSMSMATPLGSGGITISSPNVQGKVGAMVTAAGDINKDGYADFLICNGANSRTYFIYGGLNEYLFNCRYFSWKVFQNIGVGRFVCIWCWRLQRRWV